MVNITEYGNFQPIGISDNKQRIILCHTSREVKEYLTSLKFRFNGKYSKIPNYVITRKGEILKLMDNNHFSFFFYEDMINETSIVISLENLGWLEKAPLKDYYINWIGNIYKGEVYERKWRDYIIWEPYTDEQIISCANLCKLITKDFNINKKCIGHNTKIDQAEKISGIITRSNMDVKFTDLSPAFNFEVFIEKLEDE